MRKLLLFFFFLSIFGSLSAQNDDPKTKTSSDSQLSRLKLSAYLETYYIYDFNEPKNHIRPNFFYAYHRHHELTLNLGLIQADYQTKNVRARLALMAGTYPNINLAAEAGVFKNLSEAYAGAKLSKTKTIWIDAGIFSSHIGFGSAIGKDCWNMTRSLVAEGSPYYESGVKISYTSDNEKWFFSGLLLNGWQRIRRVKGNQTLAFGHQITFSPTEKITLNSSSFIGNDYPSHEKRMRYFHDFYAQLNLSEKFGVIVGFDIGMEQKASKSSEYNTWYSPILITRYMPSEKMAVALRVEHYNDKSGVIVPTNLKEGFQMTAFSLNFDYNISQNLLWRLEYRNLNSVNDYFVRNGKPVSTNQFVGSALAFSFGE